MLTWCRGVVMMDRLADPKTALLDLEDSHERLHAWLVDPAAERLERCREAAAKNRKLVPSVQPRPPFAGSEGSTHVVAPALAERSDGQEPDVWPMVQSYFSLCPACR